MTEAEMVLDCLVRLHNNSNDVIITEIPYMSRCIDMVIVNEDKEIITIEFKLKDWRKAIQQAKDHRKGADKSFICLPERALSGKLEEALVLEGIGLLLYREGTTNEYPFLKCIEAKTKENRWVPAIISLKNRINKIADEKIFCEV